MKRNYSIDLLRIVSMNMIVLLHIIGCGGILENTRLFTLNYEVSWLLEILCYCAVNCYALISGYVMCYSEIKYNKIVELWFQVVFYTIGITLLFNIFNPSSINNVDILKAFIPMMSNQYWYFTSYTGMFFFIPLMNHVINTMEKKKIEVLLVSSIILFVIFPMFLLAQFDPFYIIDGYSMIWLMTLYLFGAYFRKYSIQKNLKLEFY